MTLGRAIEERTPVLYNFLMVEEPTTEESSLPQERLPSEAPSTDNLNALRGSIPRFTKAHKAKRSPREFKFGAAFIDDLLKNFQHLKEEERWEKVIPLYAKPFRVLRNVSGLQGIHRPFRVQKELGDCSGPPSSPKQSNL